MIKLCASVLAAGLVMGCSPRSAAGEGGPIPPDVALTAEAYELEEPFPLERPRGVAWPTVGALARADAWGGPACDEEPCSQHVVRAERSMRGGPGAITRVRVVGVRHDGWCSWHLVLGVAAGWVSSLALGDSAAGCEAPLDASAIEDRDAWFPIALELGSSAIRVEGQGIEADADLLMDQASPLHVTPLTRVVHLCRVEGAVVACSRRQEVATHVRGTLGRVLRIRPFASDPTFAGLSEAGAAGRLWDARWSAAPGAEPALAAVIGNSGYGRIQEIAAGPMRVFVSSQDQSAGIYLARGGRVWRLGAHHLHLDNERLVVEGALAEGGGVRVRFARINDGSATVTWRWEEVVTPQWHALLATGVSYVAGATRAGWSRRVALTPRGVALTEGEGALAWFRGTGAYTWEELGAATARWERRLAVAFANGSRETTRAATRADEHGKDLVAALGLLDGFVEPTDRTIVDQVRRLELDAGR